MGNIDTSHFHYFMTGAEAENNGKNDYEQCQQNARKGCAYYTVTVVEVIVTDKAICLYRDYCKKNVGETGCKDCPENCCQVVSPLIYGCFHSKTALAKMQ